MIIDLTIDDLLKYKHIGKAVESLPQVGYRVQSAFRKTTPEELKDFVFKHSELYAGNGGYRTRVIYSLLHGELTEKDKLLKIIAEEVNSISTETLQSMIKSKEDGENIAFSISVLQDYISYLKTGEWRGLKSNFKLKDDFSTFIGLKDTIGLSKVDLGSNKGIFKKVNQDMLNSLSEMNKDLLIREFLLVCEELNKRGDQ
jgi:hypothetical protein